MSGGDNEREIQRVPVTTESTQSGTSEQQSQQQSTALQTSDTTATNRALQADQVLRVLGQAENLFNRNIAAGPEAFLPAQTLAGEDPSTLAGREALLEAVPGFQQRVAQVDPSVQQGLGLLNAEGLDQFISAAQAPGRRAFERTVVPGIDAAGSAVGQGVGSTRSGVLEAIARDDFEARQNELATNITRQTFADRAAAQDRAITQARSLFDTSFVPASVLQTVGGERTARTQAELDDALARQQFGANFEASQIDQLLKSLAQNIGGTATTSAVGTGAEEGTASGTASSTGKSTVVGEQIFASKPRGGLFSRGLGGAASGASMGNMIAPGGTGAAVGAGLGFLGGAFF